jgi:hypothetical protein
MLSGNEDGVREGVGVETGLHTQPRAPGIGVSELGDAIAETVERMVLAAGGG